jgi:hypothetical protein
MLPESHVDVVEIDPKVTQVAREHLGLKDYPNLQAIHMDGRQYVSEKVTPGTYDLVIQDAVNDLSVPAHLMTKEYNDAVKTALKSDGAYLLTIIDSLEYGKLWKAAMTTLGKSFNHVVLLTARTIPPAGTEEGSGWEEARQVLVIYASDKPFNLGALIQAVPGASGRLVSASMAPIDLPGSSPSFVNHLAVARDAQVINTILVPAERLKKFTDREPGVLLTDQYCPVDNLMAEVFRKR